MRIRYWSSDVCSSDLVLDWCTGHGNLQAAIERLGCPGHLAGRILKLLNFVVYDRIKWDAREAHMIVAHRFVSRENDPCVFPFAGIEQSGAAADVYSSFQPIAAQICPEGFDHSPHPASHHNLPLLTFTIFKHPRRRN